MIGIYCIMADSSSSHTGGGIEDNSWPYITKLINLATESFTFIDNEYEISADVRKKYNELKRKYTLREEKNEEPETTQAKKFLYYFSLDVEEFIIKDLALHEVTDLPNEIWEVYTQFFPEGDSSFSSDESSSENEADESSAVVPNKKLVCKTCRLTFKLQIAFNTHMKWHQITRPCLVKVKKLTQQDMKPYRLFHCDQCGYRVGLQYALKEHISKVHGEKKYKCMICKNKSYSTNRDLRFHMCLHTGEKTFKCEECESVFISNNGLRQHHRQVHKREAKDSNLGKKHLQCEHCKFYTYNGNVLTKHMHKQHKEHVKDKVDEKSGLFKCNKCNYTSNILGNVTNHSRTHVKKERTFKCSKCTYQTNLFTNLKHHSATHNDKKTHKCERCGVMFKRAHDRDAHVRTIHLRQGLHVCGVCGKQVTRKKTLLQHMKSKHNIISEDYEPPPSKTVKCTECDQSYSRKRYLLHHLAVSHNIVRNGYVPQKCEFCKAVFVLPSGLLEHIRKHHLNEYEKAKQKLCKKS